MDKETSVASLSTDSGEVAKRTESEKLRKRSSKRSLWRLLAVVIVLGVIVVIVVSSIAGYWLQHVQFVAKEPPPAPPITTFQVQRTITYAGLSITALNAQYATAFNDDYVHSGPAVVRLNMHVANPTRDPISVVYYDCAHLLVGKGQAISPTTVHLSTGPKPGGHEDGWIDFPVPKNVKLETLALQLGSINQNEALVTMPFRGAYNAQNFVNKTVPIHADLTYNFNGTVLIYHLGSVEYGYSYQGRQSKAGEQFYVFNFVVDNQSPVDATTGFVFDYLRFAVNGYNRPPLQGTLPDVFRANVKHVGGRAVFSAPAGMKQITIVFLPQFGGNNQNYDINL